MPAGSCLAQMSCLRVAALQVHCRDRPRLLLDAATALAELQLQVATLFHRTPAPVATGSDIGSETSTWPSAALTFVIGAGRHIADRVCKVLQVTTAAVTTTAEGNCFNVFRVCSGGSGAVDPQHLQRVLLGRLMLQG